MSETYTAVKVETERQRRDEEVPILFMQDVERHYRQGDDEACPGVRDALQAE